VLGYLGEEVLLMLQSKGLVRRIVKDHDRFLVSFPAHDGYFHVDDEILRKKIRNAYGEGREVSCTFDPTLKILSLT
jgi:hypothetical protein